MTISTKPHYSTHQNIYTGSTKEYGTANKRIYPYSSSESSITTT